MVLHVNIQPEKYYESCITYHLVTYFEIILDKKLYPFSISQIQEKELGYDFGYEAAQYIFFIQYKRPFLNSEKNYWKIEIEQLNTINSQDSNIDTYYCLPNFTNHLGWYEAPKESYFIHATSLKNQLINSIGNKKSITVNNDKVKLENWDFLCKKFQTKLNNAIEAYRIAPPSIEQVKAYIECLDSESKETTWGYIVREN